MVFPRRRGGGGRLLAESNTTYFPKEEAVQNAKLSSSRSNQRKGSRSTPLYPALARALQHHRVHSSVLLLSTSIAYLVELVSLSTLYRNGWSALEQDGTHRWPPPCHLQQALFIPRPAFNIMTMLSRMVYGSFTHLWFTKLIVHH